MKYELTYLKEVSEKNGIAGYSKFTAFLSGGRTGNHVN
jgi:hypothetical protein